MLVNKHDRNICFFGLKILVDGKLIHTNIAVTLDKMSGSHKNAMDRVHCDKRLGVGGVANLNRNDRVDSVDQEILE